MALYGNLPLMRKAFLQKCKAYHPDKGGDEENMKKLNTLYRTMEANIKEVQDAEFWRYSWTPEEVGDEPPDTLYIREWVLCSTNRVANCCCLMCRLARSHQQSKGNVCWRPNVWLRCYCFACFCEWFGLPTDYETAKVWCEVIGQTPMKNLNL